MTEQASTIDQAGPVDLDRLRKLAGITLGSGRDATGQDSPLTHGAAEKAAFQRKHKIEPGTDEWFKLWFARPQMTGENPYGTDTFGTGDPSNPRA
jgi:hypothetical protein